MENKLVLSKFGVAATIICTIVGVGIFSYPAQMASNIGTDGWIVTIISGVMNFLLLYLIYKIVQINQYKSYYCILESNLGSIIGKLAVLITVVYVVFAISIGLRIFAEVLKMVLLPKTPTEMVLIVMILSAIYLVRSELGTVVGFNEIAFWLMFIPLFFVVLVTMKKADFTNVLPVLRHSPKDYLATLANSVYAFGGYTIGYLLIPHTRDKKNIGKVLALSMGFVTFFYVLVCILALAVFGEKHVQALIWPTITMVREAQTPGSFVEKWEGVVMSLWVLFYFTTLANAYYFSADILKDAFKLEDVKISSLLLLPFIYIIAMYPDNVTQLYDISQRVQPYFFIVVVILLPFILLITAMAKRKRGVKHDD